MEAFAMLLFFIIPSVLGDMECALGACKTGERCCGGWYCIPSEADCCADVAPGAYCENPTIPTVCCRYPPFTGYCCPYIDLKCDGLFIMEALYEIRDHIYGDATCDMIAALLGIPSGEFAAFFIKEGCDLLASYGFHKLQDALDHGAEIHWVCNELLGYCHDHNVTGLTLPLVH